MKVPIRCVYFTAPLGLCKHNDAVRASNPNLVCIPRSVVLECYFNNNHLDRSPNHCIVFPDSFLLYLTVYRTPSPVPFFPLLHSMTLPGDFVNHSSQRDLRILYESISTLKGVKNRRRYGLSIGSDWCSLFFFFLTLA
jgi:hypothetical protein